MDSKAECVQRNLAQVTREKI